MSGGNILIGVEEESGIAKRPVVGLSASKIASIQKEMIGYNNLINPVYHPNSLLKLWMASKFSYLGARWLQSPL